MPLLFSPVYSPTCNYSLFFYLEFAWGGAHPSLSGGGCHTLATVRSLPLSKVAGRVSPLLPSPASLFIYSLSGECPPHSLELRAPCPLCYVSLFFFSSCLFIIQFVCFFFFSFLPGLGSVCQGGYGGLFQGCL
jgi:hypothetical protein